MTAVLAHPIGPDTVADWLVQDQPEDGSRLELIMGYFRAEPLRDAQHQYVGAEVWDALRQALGDRAELRPVTSVGVVISVGWRTGLIPDVVVFTGPLTEEIFTPDRLRLVAEVWSPDNSPGERETKKAVYAGAGIPFFWEVALDDPDRPTITAHRLHNGRYVTESTLVAGTTGTITAAPVPVTLDPGDLLP